jgi:outer membrane lipoprotein-sorting protein
MRYFMMITAAVAAITVLPARAEQPSVEEIVSRTNHASYYKGSDGKADVSMTITDSQGRERNRRFTILRWNAPGPDPADETYAGEQRFYVYFHRPADVSRMVFMVHKHLERDDDRWLYLPAMDLVRRIAASDKRTSFVGSDFFYEDVSGRSITLDEHELVNTTENFYILKNTPKDPSSVEFDHFVMHVHRTTFLPVQVEYFDKSGRKHRVYRALKVETIEGYPTITQSSMENLQTGGKTVMDYERVQYNVGLTEDLFTERYLRRPPMQQLK